MFTYFAPWSERVAAASDDASRQQLLAEIGAWRAAHLTDIPGLRGAAWAMAELFHGLGRADDATREANALRSLCQIEPRVGGDDQKLARGLLRRVKGEAPAADRPRERKRERAPAEPADVYELIRRGSWRRAMGALSGDERPEAAQLRVLVQLRRALARRSAESTVDAVRQLADRLQRDLLPEPPAAPAPAPERQDLATGPLAELLGRPVPYGLQARIRALENHATEHPADLDRLASLALEHHVDVAGLRKPAPWLAGIVGRALASGDAPATRATLGRLRERRSFAVSAYDEWPFGRLVQLVSVAEPLGWDVTALRRGVHRGEPSSHRAWTVRLVRDFTERLLAVAPAGYPADAATSLVTHVARLSDRTALLTPDASLREVAARRGLAAWDDLPDGEVLELLAAVEAGAAPAPESALAPEPAPKEPRGPSPASLLREALAAGATVDEVAAVLGQFRRLHRSFSAVRRFLAEQPDASLDAATHTLLTALDTLAPPEVHLPEGTTLAVRAAAALPTGRTHELLVGGGTRFGGAGSSLVVELAHGALGAGWKIARVHRGPTGRERKANPILSTLGDAASDLWRLVVRRGEVEGEVWVVGALAPEGRAAIPQLLLADVPRLVVLPLDPDILGWYRDLGGPDPVGWTGDELPLVLAEIDAWGGAEE